jgi:aquaporin Z
MGAIGAGLVYFIIWGRNSALAQPNMEINILKPLLAEAILTYVLILVILMVAASKKTAGNYYYGLAIGLAVTGIAIAGSPISGGLFNPAVAWGPMLVDVMIGSCTCNPFEFAWIYLAGPCIGSVLATYTFMYIETEQ